MVECGFVQTDRKISEIMNDINLMSFLLTVDQLKAIVTFLHPLKT